MDTPKVGTQVLCGQCGEAIEWRGEYWDHIGENKPRHPAIPATYKAAPSQPNDELEARVRGIARDEIAHFLAANTVPERPMYFIGEHWLVTYGWLADELRAISDRFQRLDRSIVRLRRSWWQRLLDRMFGGDGLGWE